MKTTASIGECCEGSVDICRGSSSVPDSKQCSAGARSCPSCASPKRQCARMCVPVVTLCIQKYLLNAIVLIFLGLPRTGEHVAQECYLLLIVQLWVRHLTSLRLRVVVCKREIIVMPTLENSCQH